MTTDELSLLLAETRCEHGSLLLEDATRPPSTDDWTAVLRADALPCAYAVRDYHAFQQLAPHLPPAWLLPLPRAERLGHDYDTDPGAISLPELAQLLAALPPSDDGAPWQLHAIHRAAAPDCSPGDLAYLVEALDPATAEVRPFPSLATFLRARRPQPTP